MAEEGGASSSQAPTKPKPDMFFYLWEPEDIQDRCIFCQISSGRHPKTKLLHQDDMCACFEDINPASQCHLLVTPRKHVKNWSHLTANDKELVLRMAEVGKKCLEEKVGRSLDPSEYRLGFVRPPFNTVYHLHMHCILHPLREDLSKLRKTSYSYDFTFMSPFEAAEILGQRWR